MHRNVIETVMGAVVLLVAGFFIVFAYSSANLRQVQGYEVNAFFDRIDGLQVGADVLISGVRVGSVVGQELDPATYRAEVWMSIDPSIQLPEDTAAVVASQGLLGGKFVSLEPGGAPDAIPPGGTIQYTQSTPGLEQLLGQVIYNLQDMTAPADDGGGAL